MSNKKVLAFSNSRVGDSDFLEMPKQIIHNFLGNKPLKITFIPFAFVSNNYEAYGDRVKDALVDYPYQVQTVLPNNAKAVIANADAIITGGGNTFKLLHDLYALDIIDLIKEKVNNGTPYIGWSAGANIAGPTIGTTNDMPIIQPQSFNALHFFSFQLNPHYFNKPIAGFNGETRDARLKEYLVMNTSKKIIALPEGTYLQMENNTLQFAGVENGFTFSVNAKTGEVVLTEITVGENISHLL
jgi:dipeptidase E